MSVKCISAGKLGQTAVEDEKTRFRTHIHQEKSVNKSLFPCACEVSIFLGSHAHNFLPEAGFRWDGQLLCSITAITGLLNTLCHQHWTTLKPVTVVNHLCKVNWLASPDTLLESPLAMCLIFKPDHPHWMCMCHQQAQKQDAGKVLPDFRRYL